MSKYKSISHTLIIFGIKFVLLKNEKGYRGYFILDKKEPIPFPLFVGNTFKQALSRLLHKALHQGLISIEDYNIFIGMSWKTPLDIEVWSKMNKIVQIEGKHFYKGLRISPLIETDPLDN